MPYCKNFFLVQKSLLHLLNALFLIRYLGKKYKEYMMEKKVKTPSFIKKNKKKLGGENNSRKNKL